jgi:exopolyphosphatase/guanosine-5'-triphosphate,3'-diphosphate pyrophosphatase
VRRTAVIDLGSNSFRLVVYDWEPGGGWAPTDEIRRPVRISAGLDGDGALRPDAIERALAATGEFASFCRTAGIDEVIAVGTSAIRDARNRDELLEAIAGRSGIAVRVLSGAEEAYYGYLAAINSTSLADGFAIEMGGGSIQLNRVERRELVAAASFPLGAVRVSERFLPGGDASPAAIEALEAHVAEEIARLGWWRGGGRLVGIGGSVRNLAAAARKRDGGARGGVQGFALTRAVLGELIDALAARPASKRGELPGIKRDRGDVILGAALVLASAMDAGGFGAVEVTRAGLREGVLLERYLAERPP